jgi:hypothetical protein
MPTQPFQAGAHTALRGVAFAVLLGPILAHADADAPVAVEIATPERYTDIGTGLDLQRNIATLQRHLKTQGAQCLRDGEKLELRVFNVDLAGRDEWWHRPGQDLRVMRDVTWPRMDMSYVWRDAQGKVLLEGREWIVDMNYLLRTSTRNDRDPLPYEKAMLHDWFDRTLCHGRHQQAATD